MKQLRGQGSKRIIHVNDEAISNTDFSGRRRAVKKGS